MFRQLNAFSLACVVFLLAACVGETFEPKFAATAECESVDNETRVRGNDECLVIRTFNERIDSERTPVLVVFLHGDKSSGKPVRWEYKVAESFVSTRAISVALLRPGYNDVFGNRSTGSNFGRRDSYTAHNIDAVAEAISALKKHHGALKLLLVGYSGGAAYAGVIIGRYPGLVDGVVLAACPCDINAWRLSKGRRSWDRSLSPHTFISQVPPTTRVIAVTGTQDTNTRMSLAESYVEMLQKRSVAAEFRPALDATHNSVAHSDAFLKAVNDLIDAPLIPRVPQ